MPISEPKATASSRGNDTALNEITRHLIEKALSPSSQRMYTRVYQIFKDFSTNEMKIKQVFPASVQTILLFIAHCYSLGLAPTTVSTYISAIGYKHKMLQMNDPTSSFLVKKMILGYHNTKKQVDCRLPVTLAVMKQLLASLAFTCPSYFLQVMLKAMYLVAFHAFLRVGEITVSNKTSSSVLSLSDIHFTFSKEKIDGFELSIRNYKHSNGLAKILFVKAIHSSECPVLALKAYFDLMKCKECPLFSFMDGQPVSRQFFCRQLKLSLSWAGLDNSKYKGHSFRIGAASVAAQQSINEEKLKYMGRWKSDAFRKYIRIPMLQLD